MSHLAYGPAAVKCAKHIRAPAEVCAVAWEYREMEQHLNPYRAKVTIRDREGTVIHRTTLMRCKGHPIPMQAVVALRCGWIR